ncbi:hypothetical protein PMAYCL1PPCAC_23212, partial [Pristionchus mayeri]
RWLPYPYASCSASRTTQPSDTSHDGELLRDCLRGCVSHHCEGETSERGQATPHDETTPNTYSQWWLPLWHPAWYP